MIYVYDIININDNKKFEIWTLFEEPKYIYEYFETLQSFSK